MQIQQTHEYALGIDIGSTTAKLFLLEGGRPVFSCYARHFSQVRQKTLELLEGLRDRLTGKRLVISISGSAGLGLARAANLPFVQEVFATCETVRRLIPDAASVVELGGEDAKVIFFAGGTDERMNGSCAGGTGAFIDQMATLLNVTPDELDALSLAHRRIYPIASRCGVFAKTDIQPLLNQGAAKADIAASIYQAVVNQTVAGLAQGRRIEGKVVFLGGPLYYNRGLRARFVETLGLDGTRGEAVFPEYGLYAVALGAAIYADRQAGEREEIAFEALLEAIGRAAEQSDSPVSHAEPLFADEAEYEAFRARHAKATVPTADPADYCGDAYLGIDCGSTTTKLVLLSADKKILYTYYNSNEGDPVTVVRHQMAKIYRLCGDRVTIRGSAVTGYGEELIRHAFHVDAGLVETMAHYTAAADFLPEVDFILDIGGQDIKCFQIRGGAIDSIMLNEACSSGCGSFIETFARSMGYNVEEFSRLGLFAAAPVELGSRCTVFMNSSVKQAQKDGAGVGDISAGLSMSVVKNALYKVIRAASPEELGRHIVVQGGTFYNDAVLRSFERELGCQVIRPAIAGLMGAYGAALHARALGLSKSELLDEEAIASFTHTSRSAVCRGCTNQCHLTVNHFPNGEKFISGNKCEKGGLDGKAAVETLPNLHQFKREKISALRPVKGKRGRIGIPRALGIYELAPLWHGIFTALGYEVILSGPSTRDIYAAGQYSIPSDTACYPAKLMHGHVEKLLEEGVDAIFYPCLTYNVDEGQGDNHYNCPVVAYYSELLAGNVDSLSGTKFLYPYLNINKPRELARELHRFFAAELESIPMREIRAAVKSGFAAYESYMRDVRREGACALAYARARGLRVMILAGRPYHIDPEIGHGIDRLAASLGFVVLTEDSLVLPRSPVQVDVLNQWTYHARLYAAAEFAAQNRDVELVQLVSFGCGIDAITTDEVRAILERAGKLYTQIKIDEITNLGAVKIRLRSLLGALDKRETEENHG
ncbi:MAG: 2-hydroxyglutaryl-CoA dehydratase [Ruminococcaceae bacterium]|nr:2-hydroxyglutaryl-CoA dehydratase [Oscillospiraceae bacterium]